MKFLVSLLGLGTTVGGVFIGSIQQNVFRTGKPYIDKLFHEIEKDIRDFSEENPITEEEAEKIKEVQSSRKRRDSTDSSTKESQYTFSAWTNLWVGLLSNYVQSLFMKDKELINKTLFTLVEKQQKFAESENKPFMKKEIEKFKKQFENVENKVKKIYEKIKEFTLLIEFPENYKYDLARNHDSPYENYIKNLEWN